MRTSGHSDLCECFFFFQAEDGIRDHCVTGVQTCALPISNPRRAARNVLPRFDDNARVLREAYVIMADDVHRGEFVTPAAEWLLDNFHLLASEVLDVRRNLPHGYYRELPKLASRELAGDARVYAMAVELIRHSDSRPDPQQPARFMKSYQSVAPPPICDLL